MTFTSKYDYSKSDEKIRSISLNKRWWFAFTAFACLAVFSSTLQKHHGSSNNNIVEQEVHNKDGRIRQIAIIGERNSGTRWIIEHLESCFNHSLVVSRGLTRYKHWFQDADAHAMEYEHDTLVICQFRNPYDWVEAMRMVPHHLPSHMNLEWKEFVTQEWNTERIGEDLQIKENHDTHICQQNFTYNQINSCVENPLPKESYTHKLHFSEHQPFYELRQDGSGTPFDNILEMRATKIYNFLSVKDYEGVADVWVAQYEYLQAKGTRGLLDSIQQVAGVAYKCDPVPTQVRRKRKLPQAFVQHLNEHVDWEAEAQVGYSQEFQQFLTIVDNDKNEN